MSDFLFDHIHQGLGKVLDLRQSQHALTASNLANADTPGFKAKYIPFDQILSKAMGKSTLPEMRRTDSQHVFAPASDIANPQINELEPVPWSVDGNSVVAEREQVRLAENAVMYNAVTTGLTKRLAMLKFAASDGKR